MHFGQPRNHKRQSLFERLVMAPALRQAYFGIPTLSGFLMDIEKIDARDDLKIIRPNMAALFEMEAPT
jgi:hypothetical protein